MANNLKQTLRSGEMYMVRKFFGYIGTRRFNIYEALVYRNRYSLKNKEKLIFL